jgi:hypothetical protein
MGLLKTSNILTDIVDRPICPACSKEMWLENVVADRPDHQTHTPSSARCAIRSNSLASARESLVARKNEETAFRPLYARRCPQFGGRMRAGRIAAANVGP